MRQGSFSVQIPQGQEIGDGYVRMQHNTRYTVKMGNHSNRRVDAEVTIDGKHMGLFRIDPGQYFDLDRPAHDASCFTFLKTKSQEGTDAGIPAVASEERGLVAVLFKSEKARMRPSVVRDSVHRGNMSLDDITERTRGIPPSQCLARGDEYSLKSPMSAPAKTTFGFNKPEGVESGGTGLTGHSNTNFQTTSALDYDPTVELTITLRLVADKAVRPLTEAPRSNPTPAAVD